MNEIRKELERQFKAFGLFNKADDEKADVSSLPEEQDVSAETETAAAGIEVPSDFEPSFADDFKNLSPQWQAYLSEREKKRAEERREITEKLDILHWLQGFEELSRKRGNNGISGLKKWFDGLVYIDEKMHTEPVKTLDAIAQAFGVKALFSANKPSEETGRILNRLMELETEFHNFTNFMQQKQNSDNVVKLQEFGAQKDEKGRRLHPYFDVVSAQMQNLLQAGLAGDLEAAYAQAVWLNPEVRSELILKKIDSDSAAAQKAQKAAFSPKGKAKAPERRLTLREELEKNMAAFRD